MRRIHLHFERSWFFLLTIPISILMWGAIILSDTGATKEQVCEEYIEGLEE